MPACYRDREGAQLKPRMRAPAAGRGATAEALWRRLEGAAAVGASTDSLAKHRDRARNRPPIAGAGELRTQFRHPPFAARKRFSGRVHRIIAEAQVMGVGQ